MPAMQVHSHHSLWAAVSGAMKKSSTASATSQIRIPISIGLRSSVFTGAGSGRRSESFSQSRTGTG